MQSLRLRLSKPASIIFQRLHRVRLQTQQQNINTLVFGGGGLKGIMFLGVIEYMKKNGMLRNITRFAGTSIGSVVATMCALELNPSEVFKDKVLRFKYDQAIDIGHLQDGFGLDTGNQFDQWLASFIPDGTTFESIKKEYGHTLIICVTNLNKRAPEYFSPDTTPHVEVKLAVRMSCAVPLFFTAVKYDGQLYTDGGVTDNFPVNYVSGIQEGGMSENILGVRFVAHEKPKDAPWCLQSFIFSIIESSLHTTHYPPNCRILTLDAQEYDAESFNTKISKRARTILFSRGEMQAESYFKKHV
jgi:predicted acylesterase/phospholipase RssA